MFEEAGARYIDLTGVLMSGPSRDDVMRTFQDLLSSSGFDLFRPVIFLLSRPATSVASELCRVPQFPRQLPCLVNKSFICNVKWL